LGGFGADRGEFSVRAELLLHVIDHPGERRVAHEISAELRKQHAFQKDAYGLVHSVGIVRWDAVNALRSYRCSVGVVGFGRRPLPGSRFSGRRAAPVRAQRRNLRTHYCGKLVGGGDAGHGGGREVRLKCTAM
jgi:hypothetical protein